MKITISDIMKHEPCEEWTEERMKEVIGEGKTLLQICQLRKVSISDRIWCVTRFLPDKTSRAFAIWCARRCKTDKKEIKTYIDVIEKYHKGDVTKEELDAADGAADWAAYRAADRAAYRAAGRAAYRAADSAAGSAAYWAAERRAQMKKLTELVRREK